jgi:putative transposase
VSGGAARFQRSEKALVARTEMYVQGVAPRLVKAIIEELYGHKFSASSISRLDQDLDEEIWTSSPGAGSRTLTRI